MTIISSAIPVAYQKNSSLAINLLITIDTSLKRKVLIECLNIIIHTACIWKAELTQSINDLIRICSTNIWTPAIVRYAICYLTKNLRDLSSLDVICSGKLGIIVNTWSYRSVATIDTMLTIVEQHPYSNCRASD